MRCRLQNQRHHPQRRQSPRPRHPLAETAPEGPKPLSAQWIREHIGAYRDAAIDDPTPQNVALYLYLQRVALDKSSRFAAATQRAVQRDPFLDEITRRPTATFAANLTNRQAGGNRDDLLRRIAETAGVLFFFRADCPYCEAQAPLLVFFRQPCVDRDCQRTTMYGRGSVDPQK